MVMLQRFTFTNPRITRRECEVSIDERFVHLILHVIFSEYVQRFATADMAESLSASITGQSSSNSMTKTESDDEVSSDFSEDEAAGMDLE